MSDLGAVAISRVKANEKKRGYLFNGDIGLARWRASAARAANGDVLVNLNIYGSSSVVGQGSNGGQTAGNLVYDKNKLFRGFVGRTRTAIAKVYGDVGSGIIPSWYTWWFGYTGTWLESGVGGMLRQNSRRGEAVGATATVVFTGTSFSVVAIECPEGGKFTISIDSGTPQEFDTFTSATTELAKEYKYNGALTNEQHTATITVTSLVAGKERSGLALIGAMYGGPSATGVRVNGIGYAGGTSDQLIPQEKYRVTTYDFWKPALSVLCFMSNDYTSSTQVTLSAFRSNVLAAINRCKQYGDVLLMPAGFPAINDTKAITLWQYVDVLRELSESQGVAFYDSYGRWNNNYASAKDTFQYIASDGVHMNDYGHQDLASGLSNALVHY